MELERAKYILAVEATKKAQLEEATKVVAEAEPVEASSDESSDVSPQDVDE